MFKLVVNCNSAEELQMRCAIIGLDAKNVVETVYKAADNIWKFRKHAAKCPTAEELYEAKRSFPSDHHMWFGASRDNPTQSMLYMMSEELEHE